MFYQTYSGQITKSVSNYYFPAIKLLYIELISVELHKSHL